MAASQDDFHLKFVGNRPRFPDRLNRFLEVVWSPEASPVVCGAYSQQTVKFKLSPSGLRTYSHVDRVAPQLCNLIFVKSNRQQLSMITSESILGISAVDINWQIYFHQAFSQRAFDDGDNFVKELETTFRDEYLPSWALVFLSCSAFGFSLGPLSAALAISGVVENVLQAENAKLASEILQKFTKTRSTRPARQVVNDWEGHFGKLDVTITDFIAAVGLLSESYRPTYAQLRWTDDWHQENSSDAVLVRRETTFEVANPHGLSPAGLVAHTYFDLIETVGDFATSNQEVINALLDEKQRVQNMLAAKSAGIGLSAMAAAASVETVPAILATSEVLAAAGLVGTAPEVLAGTTLLCINPVGLGLAVLAATGCAIAAVHAIKKRRKTKERIQDFQQIHSHILAAGYTTCDTFRLLSWIKCTDGTQPEFVDRQSEDKWLEYLPKVNSIIANDRTAQGITKYLEYQCKVLEKAPKQIAAIRAKHQIGV